MEMPEKVTLPMTGNVGRSDKEEQLPEEVWIATDIDGFIITWRNKPEVMTATRFIPASRESALQERVEKAEALLKECKPFVEWFVGEGFTPKLNGMCIALLSRISAFTQHTLEGK